MVTENNKKIHTRNCPKCNKKLLYKTKQGLLFTTKKNSLCRNCSSTAKNIAAGRWQGESNYCFGKTGSLNPFFGKQHTDETKQILRDKNLGKVLPPERKAALIEIGKQYIIQGSVYDYWLENFGKEIADENFLNFKEKQKKISKKGKESPNYGKPPPQGSGNGWSGWYKGWYFRSLMELKCAIQFDTLGLVWASAENKKYRVEYISYDGKNKTYSPDFIIGNKIYECKPKKLWKSVIVAEKATAAKEKFLTMGLEYELIDYGRLDPIDFKKLWESKSIILIDRYEIKAKEYFKND